MKARAKRKCPLSQCGRCLLLNCLAISHSEQVNLHSEKAFLCAENAFHNAV